MDIRTKTPYFFHDKPLFGLDVGNGVVTVMQLSGALAGKQAKRPHVIGYGAIEFDPKAVKEGVIEQPEVIAETLLKLFRHHLCGDITTRRVALSVPTYRTFTRSLQLPNLTSAELLEAVQLEAEQYISLPLEDLYVDYEVTRQTATSTELFMVAVPRTVADSYLALASLLGLEPILIEPTLASSARLFSMDLQSDVASFIINFGGSSSDISVIDKHLLVAGTVQAGSEDFVSAIKKHLGVSDSEAQLIKAKYGLGAGKQQAEITQAMSSHLQQIVKELRRMMRYYEERYGTKRPISQIITFGEGANMPGLNDYLTNELRLAVRQGAPWQQLDYKKLQSPAAADQPLYTTVAGLSLASPKEVLAP